MERDTLEIARLTDKEWRMLETIASRLIKETDPTSLHYPGQYGAQWNLVFGVGVAGDPCVLAVRTAMTGDISSYQVVIPSREITLVTLDGGASSSEAVARAINDQYTFGTTTPVGGDLGYLREVISELGQSL